MHCRLRFGLRIAMCPTETNSDRYARTTNWIRGGEQLDRAVFSAFAQSPTAGQRLRVWT